jgi:hypothetical protein
MMRQIIENRIIVKRGDNYGISNQHCPEHASIVKRELSGTEVDAG